MAEYRLEFRSSVFKDLKRLDPAIQKRIVQKMNLLSKTPFPPNVRKLERAERLYRIRVGDYRIIYEVDHESRSVIIQYVRHRKDAYKKL